MAEKKTEEPQEKAGGSKMKWIILILLVVLVVGGAAGAAAYFFLVHKAGGEDQAPVETSEEQVPGAGVEKAPPTPQAPLIYHELEPFTVNITTPGPVRFLRMQMTVATHSEAVGAALDKHMPRIRNDLLSLLANQDAAAMNTPEGKDALREQVKQLLSTILTQVGEPTDVSDVLFTDFVMQ